MNTAMLSAVVFGVYHEAAIAQQAQSTASAQTGGLTKVDPKVARALATKTVPTKQQFVAATANYFGVMAADVPWNGTAVGKLAQAAGGVAPNMSETFTTWVQDFPAATVADSYAHDELPVITWEPWAQGGTTKAQAKQPAYALSQITGGRYDAYITRFAQAAAAQQWPVAIRFAHEMNGDWYPWCEKVNGNAPGSYVAAWKHVHDIFTRAGANNVIWIWAPNILRGAQSRLSLDELYPGDAYVDWIGLSAYDDHETTAMQLLGPTMAKIRAFTNKPLLLAETGSQSGAQKPGWTADLLDWVQQRTDVIGFVWSEYQVGRGGSTADWRFDADPATQTAFRDGIKKLSLVAVGQ
ncbi:hypothetical protein KGA66_15605 [Actinocrinis puniceicyclus]|uniref:GH26 domain-containing protein n=1 Tax=Actinocrinis puniceicyclus TaxID=977794 RepID=A0A8J7WLD2_9ACTN|nr:glycosyl hydrolase [Actinocrinis puniceicyclus]MBS2964483.1 hypothetical protein [Actinocrinis puniceicyclus]